MTRSIISLRPEQDVIEASQMLSTRRISGAPVVDDTGNLAGILSDTDCIRALIKFGFDPDWRGLVSEFMSPKVETVDIDDSILDVAQRFVQIRYRRYPVMEDNRVVGVVSRADVLRALEKIEL
jgi:CBS domain-containing protein